MEFLKNHYEKIILGLMLLLMAVGAVVLVMEVSSVQAQLEEYRKIIVAGTDSKKPPTENLAPFSNSVAKAINPPQTDFITVHRVFNPDAWYVNTNGDLIQGTNVGVNKLAVPQITPQHLKLWFDSIGGTPGRESIKINAIREFARNPQDQGKRPLSLSLTMTNTVNTLDPASKMQIFAREIGGTPEVPEVKFELVEPNKEPVKFTMSKAQGYTNVVEYVAHIYYIVETNFVWRTARKGTPLVFAGDTNIVVEITGSNVVVRATSNDKQTTIPLGSGQSAPMRPKAP